MSALSILAEECELLNDSKYRSYITQVDKALKSFDSTSEWADLISALAKLNKVLLAHVKYPVIPKRVTIGKRLAQCLHPALPGGVHMKALETYDIIFKCIGTDRLAQDLFIYTAGLFPLLSHAAMNVKPILLLIYERHFVNLGKRIKPGLNGLLLGLLPGLEEGSEFYEQTNALLEKFCDCTEPSYFYTCLWECIHSCPSARLQAITYLVYHFNKKQTMEDQLYMIGLNINLMVEAICSTVQDTSVLVQRSMLDFLMVAFPLHNSQLTHSDMAKIVKAAITVLLRRDMSLNRRFYAWLLGTSTTLVTGHPHSQELKSEFPEYTELSYFDKFSHELLIHAIKFKLNERHESGNSSSIKSTVLKPFRILISLLDKPEIGPVILESVLLAIFRCLHREFLLSNAKSSSVKDTDEMNTYDELLKTANLLFGTFEPYFVWDYVARMFDCTCSSTGRVTTRRVSSLLNKGSLMDIGDKVTVQELCHLVAFLLDTVSLETFSETQMEHLPNLLCSIINSLTQYTEQLSELDVITSLQLCTKILSKVQPTMTTFGSQDLISDRSSQDHEAVGQIVSLPEHVQELQGDGNAKSSEVVMNQHQESEAVQKPAADSEMSENKSEEQENVRSRPSALVKEHGNNKANNKTVDNNAIDNQKKMANVVPLKRSLSRKLSRQNHSTSLIQNCIGSFQNYFHLLVVQKLIKNDSFVQKCMEALSEVSEYSSDLGCLDDDSCIDSETATACFDRFSDKGRPDQDDLKLCVDTVSDDGLKLFSSVCQLLVEFASFPVYGQDIRLQDKQSGEDKVCLPIWIQDLVTCCCFVENIHVQLSAISTILDLIILTQSLQMESKSGTTGDLSSRDGTISAQILPTLHFEDLKFLAENTNFFKLSAETLWNYMGNANSEWHFKTVKLFHIVHQVAPSSWICENVMGRQLVHNDETLQIEAFKKFFILWHLTRSETMDVIPGKPLRTFDRSMFVILDSLKMETSTLKVLSTTWLSHVIQHGDIHRIMEPLLLMLLHPDSARVSVQHVDIHQPRTVHLSESSEENVEANIYAISSEGGNVIYHVSSTKELPKKQMQEESKSYTLTVLGDRGAHTAPLRSRSEQELDFDKVDPSKLSLRINPFGSESSLDRLFFGSPTPGGDNLINKARRLDRETCVKEGISFIVEPEEYSQGETTEDELKGDHFESSAENVSAGVFVQEIINKIIENVTKDEISSVKFERVSKEKKQPPKNLAQRADSVTSSCLGESELLNSIQKQGADSPTLSEKDIHLFTELDKDTTNIHPLHMHILLYTQRYDYDRTIYALSTIKSILIACQRLMVTSLITTNISSLRPQQLTKLQLLLSRHRKSVFGKNFFGEIPANVLSSYRSSMFVEVMISVCLYFIRGYYPNLMMSKISLAELLGNKQVHIIAVETLTLIMSQIICIMRDSGKNFVSYINDLLKRCKVQKALLHCLLAVIYNNKKKADNNNSSRSTNITETIITFNEEPLNKSVNEAFEIKLLDLLLVMIMLEEQIGKFQTTAESSLLSSEWDRLKVNYQPSLNNVQFNMGHSIVQQGMFVSAVLCALKQKHNCYMHRHWVAMVTAALPYMGKSLPGIVKSVVAQLCRNIEGLAEQYEANNIFRSAVFENVPPDHLLTILEGLLTLCHYCLLDNVSPVSIGQQAAASGINLNTANETGTNILINLLSVFSPMGGGWETNPQNDQTAMLPVLESRNHILSVMPAIIACMVSLWRAVNIVEKLEDCSTITMGSPKVVRQYILKFISPISLPHSVHLLGAIAVAWNERQTKSSPKNSKSPKKVMSNPSEDQLLLVELVAAIKVLPIDTLIQTVKDVLKHPPASEMNRTKRSVSLEVNMLQFFYAYIQRIAASQLTDAWPSLVGLLREALQLALPAPGQFLLLLIVNEFVQKNPCMVDKKNQKEVQEISQKVLEVISVVAGSSLEQSTWLRRNYSVKPGIQPEDVEIEEGNQTDDGSVIVERRVADFEPASAHSAKSKYSVQALCVLAEMTAHLLDVIYSSEEKDKVATFLTTMLYNIFPYLKSHSIHNLPSLRAASQFLASISSYQYTRKAWKREAFELLLDSNFFQMDIESIGYWITIVDNLMTHDKTTYKDLMARVTMAQTGSLNLFSNKDQEIEQKAGMLKRLAFTVFCSESDQYQKSIPEIQEKLAESLRITQAPSVLAQVFLCFRVLMLRVSPQHLTSMWPTIITELIYVFLQIEQELSTETEEFVNQVQHIAALDSSWAHLGNGLNAHNNPSWMQLYLSACKLLDLCLALPADNVPQFQLYRWAFIGGAAAGEGSDDIDDNDEKNKKSIDQMRKASHFKPHIIRLARLLNSTINSDVPIMKMTPGQPLLTLTRLRSLHELQPFFNTLCLANQTDNLILAARQLGAALPSKSHSAASANGHLGSNIADHSETKNSVAKYISRSKSAPSFPPPPGIRPDITLGLTVKSNRQYIEDILRRDFLESMP